MRKICLALCLTLFASLIHAAVMPVDLSSNQSHQTVAMDISSHHCDEDISNTQDSNTNQSCHSDSYQCCLGLVVALPSSVDLAIAFTEELASIKSSLTLQSMTNFIFRPPRG